MRKIDQSVVVVTGASSGIGRACALAFAEAGASVVLTARRGDELEEVARQCRLRGADALPVAADVTDDRAVSTVARRAVAAHGRIDVWVNNAAVIAYGRLEEVPPELWRRVVETDLIGTYHGARAALPWFREQGGGVLITVSSILGKAPAPFQSAYVAAKHGQLALAECIRQETTDVPGIRVSTVLPGPVDTPLFASGANVTGRRVVPPGAPVDPRRVAAAVVRCARRPKAEAVVGASTRLGLLGTRLAPRLAERVTARAMRRMHFSDERAERTEGNVLRPCDGAGIDGGWREPDRGRTAGVALGVGGAALVGAVVAARHAGRTPVT
ncbi:SDR family NAD(P)-dependent oxidoreductase [Trujillonella humicola]|uniref:SDR family NAD(P)-dependent oxidoreductase n=1 Tax=Trujillonella humicola TaxID=3383699 RepID=UPI003905E193